MGDLPNRSTPAPQCAGLRGFRLLSHYDMAQLEAFFLAFDFDQRRTYFGGGISDASIRKHCRSIHWAETTIIACAGPDRLDAIAVMTAIPSMPRTAELSLACPLLRGRSPIIA